MKGKDVKRPSQKQTNPKDQELQFKEELKQKFGQNINYQSPNRYTLMENFNYRNPSYGVTVEYKFLHTIQDCGLLESSQLQYFMNLFRKAYPDVKLAAASCYFFGDLIVTSQQAIQPQQQPIVFKLDWKRPTVQETPSQEQNKVQEAPKTTINKELPSSQNSQLQNKKSTEENQKLSQNNNLEQNEQQNKNSAQKNQSQVPHSEIVSIQQPLHSQVKQNKPQVQQNPQSEIISSNSQMQQITNSQDKSSQNQSQGYQHQQRKIKPKEELYNDYEISRHSQKQETHNNNQTEQINYQKRQHNNTQEIQANSPIQQSNVFEQPLSNQESQELSKEIQKQEQHQPDQIKKQDDEKIEKSLQSTQSNQKQYVIGQVIQQKYEGDTSNKKQTYAASEIISSREDSTQVKQQSTQKPKRQYQDITQAPQNSNQISVNQDNSQVEAGQIKQTFQQDQKEVPIVQAPEIQDQAKPVNIVEPPKQEPAKQYHFQISSIIEQNPQKEVLSTSQLGSLIKQFAEINNLSDDQLKHQDYWFFPINQQQAHWVSVVVELQTKVIYYFDSYYEKIDPLITKGINSILDYFNLNSKVFKIKEIYNKQENCYDCGIFLLLSLLYTLRRKEYDYNQKLINKYRESILYQLAVIGAQADIDKDFLEKLIS